MIFETAAIADGSRLRVRVVDERLRLRVPNTGDYGKYAETTAGRVTLSRLGVYDLEVWPCEQTGSR